MIRNLMVFNKNGKRYRVVFTAPTKSKAYMASNMYDKGLVAIYYDSKKNTWLVGVRR